MRSLRIFAIVVVSVFPVVHAVAADESPSHELLLRQKEESLAAATRENLLLKERVRQLEAAPAVTGESLARKNHARLREIARDTAVQRQAVADFECFVSWLGANLSGYAKYIQAGSVLAGFAKVLPIPYAGQASVLTKFVSQAVLSLNAASVAMTAYLDSSQKFMTRVDALDAPTAASLPQLAAAARYADEQLLKDMEAVRVKLSTISGTSSSALSFLESLNFYAGSTDEYWAKTKSLLKRDEKKEKSFLTENIEALKERTASFNQRMQRFEELARRDAPLIKSVAAYEELRREMEAGAAQVPGEVRVADTGTAKAMSNN